MEAAEISALLNLLVVSAGEREPPVRRLRVPAARSGLEALAGALAAGPPADPATARAVLAAARAVVWAVLPASVEQVESTVVEIVERSLEFCLLYLEKLSYACDDFGLLNEIACFLESLLLNGAHSKVYSLEHGVINDIIEQLACIQIEAERLSPQEKYFCYLKGFNCLESGDGLKQFHMVLSPEYLQRDYAIPENIESCSATPPNGMVSLAQHFAVVHLNCKSRLLTLVQELCQSHGGEMVEDINIDLRLSFTQRIFKLIYGLAVEFPSDDSYTAMLFSVARCADILPALFRLKFKFSNHDRVFAVDGVGTVLLQILEEFLQLMQIIVCNGDICCTIQVCIVASLLEIFSPDIWRYESSGACLVPPLAYSPHVIQYVLKLLKDTKRRTSRLDRDTPDKVVLHYSCKREIDDGLFCHVRSEDVPLLKKYSCEEYLQLLFPTGGQWLDGFVHLIFFLHEEGVKSMQTSEKQQLICPKQALLSELESVASHEEEALFGNLFAEVRHNVVVDSVEQPTSIGSSSGNQTGLVQLAADLICFMKIFIFSPEWCSAIYMDACKKFNIHHLDLFLSILKCQACSSDENNTGNTPFLSENKLPHINAACFELLQMFLVCDLCPTALREGLVEKVFNAENGRYTYNRYTLALGAHAVTYMAHSGFSLGRMILIQYVGYLLGKKNDISSSLNVSDFCASLPCAFHLEIILVAFHLTTESEKADMIKIMLSSLEKMNEPPPGVTAAVLTRWALLLSRLLLVLRQMLLYPLTHPSWLFMRLRSRLRAIQLKEDQLHSINDCLPSFATAIVERMLGNFVKKNEVISDLLSHLIDVTPAHTEFYFDKVAVETLGFNMADLSATISKILNSWSGRSTNVADDLIVERYLFMICWSTLSGIGCCVNDSFLKDGLLNPDFADVNVFLSFALSISNISSSHVDVDLPASVFGLLKKLHSDILCSSELVNWDLPRRGAWLSFVLSLVNAGLWRQLQMDRKTEMDSHRKQEIFSEELFALGKSLVTYITENRGHFLDVLSSLFEAYLDIFKKAYLSFIACGRPSLDCCYPSLLLKHSAFDKSKHHLFSEKFASHMESLESICELSLRINRFATELGEGQKNCFLQKCFLHGFPSDCTSNNSALLSSILVINEIMETLDGFIKVTRPGEGAKNDAGVISKLLRMVMAVRSDQIFSPVRGQCDSIFMSIISNRDDLARYSELFILKQLEGFLADINSNQSIDGGAREILVSTVIDVVEDFRSKADVFKFFLGDSEGAPEGASILAYEHADMSTFIDVLDKCKSEQVNLKILHFFTDVLSNGFCPGLMQKLQKKFIGMEVLYLSSWLESVILGPSVKVESKNGTVNSATRELGVDFFMRLMCSSETLTKDLQHHLFNSMILLLDRAFLSYDLQTAKAYFHFIIQLSGEESHFKHLFEKTLMLTRTLVEDEDMLHALKFLLSFVDSVFGDTGLNRSCLKRTSKKTSASSPNSGSLIPKQFKISENLLIPSGQDSSPTVDCDASSAEEDEDDGTSDGELGSMDRDEEDEGNSDRALASKVCTFTSSGSNFMEQHWYFCYTCDLTVSKGCCSVCAKVCHGGHRVVYSRSSRFFCDCGAGGVRGSSCQCLKPRKFTGTSIVPPPAASSFQPILPFNEDVEQAADSASDFEDDMSTDADNSIKLSVPKELSDTLPIFLKDLGIEARMLEICKKLLPTILSQRELNLLKDRNICLGGDVLVSHSSDIFQLKKAFKSGSLDLKIKADYPNSRELKSHLANGSLSKSLLDISTRGKLAVGEGDKVAIFDVGQVIGQPTATPITADKTNVKPLSRNIVRFEIVHLVFNALMDHYLAVAGYEDCQVLTLNNRGEVTDRLAIELALQGAYIRRMEWVPGSQVQLMVVTSMFVKIYDLSQDNISPIHYFTIADDIIVDATLVPSSMGKLVLLVLSEGGLLYKLNVALAGDVGAKILTETVLVQDAVSMHKGLSLYFSPTYRLLFVSHQDGTTFMGRLDASCSSITELSYICEEDHDGKSRPAGLHRWRELVAGTGILSCLSKYKSNSPLAVSLGPHMLVAQNMRHITGSNSSVAGVAAYKPLSKDKTHCLLLYDDGSLHIYSHVSSGGDSLTSLTAEQTKKLGSRILSSRAYASTKPEFPLDFFEKTTCITCDMKFNSDTTKSSDSESIKQRLTSDDGYLESLTSAGSKVTISNSNPDIVMVGCRIHVGNTSAGSIPSEITIFHRIIKLDEGMRSWYDIPFTTAESLLADEEITITVGRTFDGSSIPRIDSIEVYGRAKDEFGWKEKMDAVLDMEALGGNSCDGRSGKGPQIVQAAPIEEQVLADALRILSHIYFLCRPYCFTDTLDGGMELNNLKCRAQLESIFQSDKEPLLLSAACRVLQAVFPKKDIYYHVKDTMRLLGVIKSLPAITSRIGVGGAASSWVIKEFVAQIHTVSKVALHRKLNLASFLETRGTELVEGLMQVFWGILDLDRPDTQTINSLVVPCVEFIYSYAECLALHSKEKSGVSVAPAAVLLKKLLFAPYEAVQTSSSLAISSRFLQVPFPKQTMIANDDTPENHAKVSGSSMNSITGNAQVMIEEDPATSSVQYCCDGCSTVPILRQRWHCNICPDFDLCETCYEILDADRLPAPHSKDHPMSAVPIELDSFGGESNEIHFSIDELTDSGVLHAPADTSVQTSPSSIHVLDASESGDFPETGQRTVSISASKREINSLLLSHLIEDLRGWMGTTSGTQAIPIMQLFYRLSSAVGGPFMDSSKPDNMDLEKFVKWFMDEININKPFPAKTRCSFGEVSILVFIFFTLMLRNWHQPGGDSSHSKSSGSVDLTGKSAIQVPVPSMIPVPPSSGEQDKHEFASQLVCACSTLRQQSFLNYLMDILQQLVHFFKSSSMNVEAAASGSGCGSLLTVRRELPAGNFSPFFSDSYAKSHPTDLFMDYYKLLLENTFRLVYSMVRPEKEKSAEKDRSYKVPNSKDLKLDGYQDVLCSYISNPHTTFVRRYARRLFLHLCGSKTHYYSVRDSWQYSHEIKKLRKIIEKSGGFQNPVPYERSVKLIKCLTTLCDVAAARPKNWQKFCLKHMDLVPFLMDNFYHFSEECVIQTLKLINLAFYSGKDVNHNVPKPENVDHGGSTRNSSEPSGSKKKRKCDDCSEGSSDKSCMDMEEVVEMFNDKDGDMLKRFVDIFLLEWNSAGVRHQAKCVLFGVWYHAKNSLRETMLRILLQKVIYLPVYGQNIVEYTDLMTCLLGKVYNSSAKQNDSELLNRCLTSEVISCIFDTLHSQNELLANHPNSRIYNTLSCLVEFDGYYLESEPCVTCSCPDIPYSRMKLESLKSETKFTDNRIIIKCTGSFTIQSVTMNVYDARKSKSVKVLNLYYNNRPVTDLSELKNNWSLWKRAKCCHLTFNQTELKVDFPIPITACNFMIELDSFYENLQASSLESLQCPRCSRSVTDKHGICSNCHENAYQCRQCRNINYENLDSFLCNECGYSKYGRFEFHFMAKPSFSFDNMENDEDMRKGLTAIESESENAHRRYQQLMGFKKPLIKLVSSIGEQEIDSQQKDAVQQMMVSLPGPTCKVNRKIALLGVLYGEKCKAAFDSVSKSVQTLQGLRHVLMTYLHQKNSTGSNALPAFSIPRSPSSCYGCSTMFVTQCLELLQVLSKQSNCRKQLVKTGILSELFENNIHQGPRTARTLARAVLSAFSEGDADAVQELNNLILEKVMYCLEHHRSMDIALSTREELLLLSETCALVDEFWEARLRIAFQILFASIKVGAKHPAISEHIILPCLRIISHACTPPKSDGGDKEAGLGKSSLMLQSKNDDATDNSIANITSAKVQSEISGKSLDGNRRGTDIPLLSYSEWESGASYLDFVRRQYKVSQAVKGSVQKIRHDSQKADYLVLKYGLRWKRRACRKSSKSDFSKFALGSWVSDLILSSCSQSIRSEICTLVSLLCPSNSPRQFQLLNLLLSLLPRTLSASECAAEYFELLRTMVDSETSRLFLTVRGCLATLCSLITKEVSNIESQERSLSIDISQGFILHKLIELLNKFLEISSIRARFMSDSLLSEILEAFLVIRGLVVQKTKLINDCNRFLKDLLDSLLVESTENKRQFIRACISGLQKHVNEKKRRTSLFILEQLCNLICPVKPEPVYLLILNKAHTQEEFIRGSMTKNPYSSVEIGPLMRDVKNKICHQLDLIGLLEDDYGMELLVAGNIISLDLSVSQVYEQVWRKHHSQTQHSLSTASTLTAIPSVRDCPPMTITYRLQGLDGEATEPMIKELEEEREESQDPEIEFAIAGAVRECGGLEIILSMIQSLRDDELRSNQEELASVLNLLKYCCNIRENRRALLSVGALGLLLETARRAFSADAMEPAEGILLIVESLTMEANANDISIAQSVSTTSNVETGAGEEARKIVLMFLERLSHHVGAKKSNKQQRNEEMVARILPYLTYGEPAAMEALVQHFDPYLRDWPEFDCLQRQHEENPKDDSTSQKASMHRSAVENFVHVSESLKTSSCGERLKEIILEKGITKAAVKHVKESFGFAAQADFRTSAEWTFGLKLPSIPLILSMLKGLAKGHLPTQKCIDDEGILPLLHALEGVPGENEIGARAENLLDTLANKESNGDGFLGEKIQELRHATRDEMRRRALKKREMLLQGLGMRQEFASDGGRRIVVSQPIIEGLDDVEEEEDGLACMVCREGYSLRPTDMLGVYAFSKRVNLGTTCSGSGRGDCVYTTVSHFNIIHYQCHQEAKRADAALKNPKKEWDGATLRNNETLCNCMFPLRGPLVPLGQYTRCVDQYWDQLNSLGRADGSRLRLLTYDIVLMLARFATGASFSTDSKGGGKESNSRFLPFMVQMASHLVDGSANQQQRHAMAMAVTTYLSSSQSTTESHVRLSASVSGSRAGSGSSEETVQFMMVSSLLSESYESWLQHRPAFLQKGIYHAYMQHKHGRSAVKLSPDYSLVVCSDEGSSTDTDDSKMLFAIVQPMLVYTGLIEQLQHFFKKGKSSSMSKRGEDTESGGNLEKWEIQMKQKLDNMKEMVGFSKDILSWLDDMMSSDDLQEAFDVMGVLADVFSRGHKKCEDFVRAAIHADRS